MRLPHDALFYLAVDLKGRELPVVIKICLAFDIFGLFLMQSWRDILFIIDNNKFTDAINLFAIISFANLILKINHIKKCIC